MSFILYERLRLGKGLESNHWTWVKVGLFSAKLGGPEKGRFESEKHFISLKSSLGEGQLGYLEGHHLEQW